MNQGLTRRQLLRGLAAVGGSALMAACSPPTPPATATPVSQVAAVQPTVANPIVVTAPPATMTALPTATVVNSAEQAAAMAQASIDLVNQARNGAGLASLESDPVLMQVAMSYAQRMAAEDFYGHEDPQGNDVTDRYAAAGYLAQISAENIARGQPDAATVVQGWLNSPGHRANILNADLEKIGAGYAYTATPPYHHYWVHNFATPDASVGRDRSQYPAQIIDQVNQMRQAAGVDVLAQDDTLTAIANTQLQSLLTSPNYEDQVETTLQATTQAALGIFTHAVALSAAGSATPEDAVQQWAQGNDPNPLVNPAYTAAGVAYVFVEQDDYRHYWLLLLAG